jgi:hypothetical protein
MDRASGISTQVGMVAPATVGNCRSTRGAMAWAGHITSSGQRQGQVNCSHQTARRAARHALSGATGPSSWRCSQGPAAGFDGCQRCRCHASQPLSTKTRSTARQTAAGLPEASTCAKRCGCVAHRSGVLRHPLENASGWLQTCPGCGVRQALPLVLGGQVKPDGQLGPDEAGFCPLPVGSDCTHCSSVPKPSGSKPRLPLVANGVGETVTYTTSPR